MSLPIALFRRQYLGYKGGHGKVWDYFQHLAQSGLYEPRVYFTPDSIFEESNPWRAVPEQIVPAWEPAGAALLFLEGLDWADVPRDLPSSIPILNLIQHPRHAVPGQPRYEYLSRRAIRICVSKAVSDAICATGRVNGPVFTIPCGLQLPTMETSPAGNGASLRVLVGGLKDPPLASLLAESLRSEGFEVDVLVELLPRSEFLKRVAQAGIVVLLPHRTEGFYLPGLEAMALGKPVIMPDCAGNMEYARHGQNCLIADPDGIPIAVRLLQSGNTALKLASAGLETAKQYRLELEYQRFMDLLANTAALWSAT